MQKNVLVGGITLILVVLVAVLWVQFSAGLSGDVSKQHRDDDDGKWDRDGRDRDGHDGDFEFRVRPKNKAFADETVVLTARADEKISSVTFTARNGDCVQELGIDSSKPYSVSWKPSAGNCGAGNYTLKAVATRNREKSRTVSIPYVITSRVVDTRIDSQTENGNTLSITSSDVYPPAVGSGASQTLATIALGPTTTANERFVISGFVTARKISGGSFDVEYRIIETTSGVVLGSGTLTDPTNATTRTFSATLTAPTSGMTGELALQFRSAQTFSAAGIDAFELTVEHYGMR